MTRLLLPPHPITVHHAANGRLTRFVWQGVTYQVERIIEQHEVDCNWYEPSGRIHRAYTACTTTDGRLVVLYRDMESGEYFLSKIYD